MNMPSGPTEPPLEALQRWMLAMISDPRGVAAALQAQAVPPSLAVRSDQLAQVILPGPAQSPLERLEVYRHAYFARLLEVLRNLFPCLRYAVGDAVFDTWMVGYVQAYPPSSYTLSRLADRLPDYLDATRPADWGRFVVELAHLERAIDRVFEGPGPEGLPPLTLPDRLSGNLRLSLAPGTELHAFAFPVSRYYTEFRQGGQPTWPVEERQWVVLTRRDYVVRRYELSEPQFAVLRALSAGQPLEEALAAGVAAYECGSGELPADLPAQVHRWFAFWAGQGLFVAAQ
jgi:hypothetical protein